MNRLATLCLIACAAGCSGGYGRLRFDGMRYPVSLSPTVPDAGGQILPPERLEVVGRVDVHTRAWSIAYSAIPLQATRDVSKPMNAQIAAAHGEAVINLRIVSKQCKVNHVWVLNAIPLWPGCSDVTLTGDIIRATEAVSP